MNIPTDPGLRCCVCLIFIVSLFASQRFGINPFHRFNRNIVIIYRIYNRTGTIIQFGLFNCAPNVHLMARGTKRHTVTTNTNHMHVFIGVADQYSDGKLKSNIYWQ